jgi:hypothetical protein
MCKYFVRLFWFLICASNLPAQTQQQYSVSGAVLDAETGRPLPNANVFLANTMKGSVTDTTGRFLIRNVPVGTFEMVVSRVGYEVAKREISVSGELVVAPAFKLRPVVLSGADVEVTAPYPKKWKSHLERFTDLLFSNTKNAAKTKILNPHVLEFLEEQDDQFVAKAPEPLHIENWALGYKLNLILDEFIASPQKLQYKGSIKFDELTPSSGKQAKNGGKTGVARTRLVAHLSRGDFPRHHQRRNSPQARRLRNFHLQVSLGTRSATPCRAVEHGSFLEARSQDASALSGFSRLLGRAVYSRSRGKEFPQLSPIDPPGRRAGILDRTRTLGGEHRPARPLRQ